MTSTTRRCSTCGGQRLVELQMTVKAGPVLTMLRCSACESSSWLVDGVPTEVEGVLAAAARDPHFVLTPSRRAVRAQPGRAGGATPVAADSETAARGSAARGR